MKNPDCKPVDIKYLLGKRGLTYRDVDRKYGLKEGVANKAAQFPVKKGEQAIAHALGVQPETLWPSRYDQFGNRLKPQPRVNYIPEYKGGTTTSHD